MKILLVFFIYLLVIGNCEHLIVGDTNSNRRLIYHTTATYAAMPSFKRVKNVFYSGHSVINVSELKKIKKYVSLSRAC